MYQNGSSSVVFKNPATIVKRLVIIILSLCLLFSATVPAFAATAQSASNPFSLQKLQSARASIVKEWSDNSVYDTSLIRLSNELIRLKRDINAGKSIQNENDVKAELQNAYMAVKAINLDYSNIKLYAKKGESAKNTAEKTAATQKRLDSITKNLETIMKYFNITASSDISENTNPPSEAPAIRTQDSISEDYTEESRVDTKDYAREVFRLVNKERKKAGLSEVEWDDDFAMCAEIRAKEASTKFSHERPGDPDDYGRDWPRNVSGGGIYNAPTVADEQGVDYVWVMENLGKGYQTPEAVVKGWMKSSGHRKNILKESHTRCGVGFYNYTWALWLDE